MARISPTAIKAAVRDDYDAAAPSWEPFMSRYFRFPAQRLVADLAPRRLDRCLDLACGSALVARAFAARVPPERVRACDLSPVQVREARRILEEAGFGAIQVDLMDAEHLGYLPMSFERIGCAFGINHFPRPLTALRGILRALAPGGRTGLTVWRPFDHPAQERFERRLMELVPALRGDDAGLGAALERIAGRNSRPDRVVALMERAGFVQVEVRGHAFRADLGGAEWYVDAMLGRSTWDLEAAGIRGRALEDVRAGLVVHLSALPSHAFLVRRPYLVILGRRPAS